MSQTLGSQALGRRAIDVAQRSVVADLHYLVPMAERPRNFTFDQLGVRRAAPPATPVRTACASPMPGRTRTGSGWIREGFALTHPAQRGAGFLRRGRTAPRVLP